MSSYRLVPFKEPVPLRRTLVVQAILPPQDLEMNGSRIVLRDIDYEPFFNYHNQYPRLVGLKAPTRFHIGGHFDNHLNSPGHLYWKTNPYLLRNKDKCSIYRGFWGKWFRRETRNNFSQRIYFDEFVGLFRITDNSYDFRNYQMDITFSVLPSCIYYPQKDGSINLFVVINTNMILSNHLPLRQVGLFRRFWFAKRYLLDSFSRHGNNLDVIPRIILMLCLCSAESKGRVYHIWRIQYPIIEKIVSRDGDPFVVNSKGVLLVSHGLESKYLLR